MGKFNSAWLLRKRPFRSLTGVDGGTFYAMAKKLRPHWRERVFLHLVFSASSQKSHKAQYDKWPRCAELLNYALLETQLPPTN